MKKTIVVLFCLILLLLSLTNKEEQVLIPETSIRYRIIANSNSIEDQRLKLKINAEIMPILNEIMQSSTTIYDARTSVRNVLPKLEEKVSKYVDDYNISYSDNYFPEKEYKGIKYNEGDYESLVITIGSGNGANWWCVMFPPLCLMEAKETDLNDIEYKSYIKEVINKYI